MNYLMLESAVEGFSVAVSHQNQLLAQIYEPNMRQTEGLLTAVDTVLNQAGLTLSDVDVIAFSKGPGAFSGIRINIAIAQALAWSLNIPLIAVPTLQIIAQKIQHLTGASNIVPILDARMQELYIGQYDLQNNVQHDLQVSVMLPYSEDVLVAADTPILNLLVKKTVPVTLAVNPALALVGASGLQQIDLWLPEAQYMIPYAIYAYQNGNVCTPEQAQPLYLREDAWKKLEQQSSH